MRPYDIELPVKQKNARLRLEKMESERGTGRTSKLLFSAISSLIEGNDVFFVMSNDQECADCMDRIQRILFNGFSSAVATRIDRKTIVLKISNIENTIKCLSLKEYREGPYLTTTTTFMDHFIYDIETTKYLHETLKG